MGLYNIIHIFLNYFHVTYILYIKCPIYLEELFYIFTRTRATYTDTTKIISRIVYICVR